MWNLNLLAAWVDEGGDAARIGLQEEALVQPEQEREEASLRRCCGGTRLEGFKPCWPAWPRVAAVTALGAVAAISMMTARAHARGTETSDPTGVISMASKKKPSLGVAVCVVGEMARLEIGSKIANIAEPLAAATSVDFFLSLETGVVVYNNPATDLTGGEGCQSLTRDPEVVKEAFAPYFKGGRFKPHRDEDVVPESWPYLYQMRHHHDATGDDKAARSQHIANVVSQMRHQRDCAELIEAHENSMGARYDVVLKVRDNSIALRPVVPEKLLSIFAVTLKHCNYWWGVHDKVMALPRDYLDKTLGAMYSTMMEVMSGEELDERLKLVSEAQNTEQVVKYTLLAMGALTDQKEFSYPPSMAKSALPDGGDYLPFVDGRCQPTSGEGDQDHWCIVTPCKDCWPLRPWASNISCVVSLEGTVENMSTMEDFDQNSECDFGMLR